MHTRTGRPFFPADRERAFLDELHRAVDAVGLWDELDTDWVLLDGEILPWSLKAGELIRDVYASVGTAAVAATTAANAVLDRAVASGIDVSALAERNRVRSADAVLFRDAYRRFVGPDTEVRFAPFQALAAEGATFESRDHGWHLSIADRLVASAPDALSPTARRRVDLNDADSVAEATEWWTALTEAGGEGMVVKPFANLTRTAKNLAQPGIKVRGREYLRIIYGPDYTVPENLARLRERDTGRKRSLAVREYALGLEALRRLVDREPLWRRHEAVFAVLALESDPLDPRL